MTFIDVLNDPVSRKMIDSIEDIRSSLRAYPDGEEILEDILANKIKELKQYNGYEYVLE